MRFINESGQLYLKEDSRGKIYDTLPVGVYTVEYNDLRNEYYLEASEELTLPDKLYGNLSARADKIINTFNSRPKSTGVLLSGTKGSGKTLLSKLIVNQSKLPVLLINQPFAGDSFNRFVQAIKQDCLIMFDEFEKVYNKQAHQEMLLTLLDGVFETKKLFLFTVNEQYSLNTNLLNRPGRIFYHLKFEGLDSKFTREYCELNLLPELHHNINILCGIATTKTLSFDILQAIVEELNRYKTSLQEILQEVNYEVFRSDRGGRQEYKVTGDLGNDFRIGSFYNDSRIDSIIPQGNLYLDKGDPSSDSYEECTVRLDENNVADININDKVFTFITQYGQVKLIGITPINLQEKFIAKFAI